MIEVHYSPRQLLEVVIMLEEAGLPYVLRRYDLFQVKHWYPPFAESIPTTSCRHRRHLPCRCGAPLAIFESGAILIYLAERSGNSSRRSPQPHGHVAMAAWQISGLGQ